MKNHMTEKKMPPQDSRTIRYTETSVYNIDLTCFYTVDIQSDH